MGPLIFVVFLACIPAANWLIGNVGATCVPQGPCLIPVWPGLMAPSGVLMIGLALVLRDLIQRRLGASWALAAIGVGGALSGLVAPPALAIASVAAFLLSELADFAIYTPLQRRGLILAVVASGVVGAAVDSAAFLLIAFGDLTYLPGQIVGKLWATAAAGPVILLARRTAT